MWLPLMTWALRGFDVTVVERGEVASGTSGRTHGLLHSGGRYAVTDRESAVECIEENFTLRKICSQMIEPNGGLFVALDETDLAYAHEFVEGCQACHIPVEELTPHQALALEPNLNPRLVLAYSVPDGTIRPVEIGSGFCCHRKKQWG